MNSSLGELLAKIEITEKTLWVGFGVFIILYAILSGVLIFHWRTYGMKNSVILFAEILFLLVSALFVFMAVVGLSLTSI